MAIPEKLKGRYEIREVLGKGGMGLVFRAWDGVVKREVALKTLRDAPTRAALQMFHKECELLAAISHPNIVEIFDIGEYEEEGKSKPFFVMPLLPGATLEHLIRTASHRLTVERVVDIMSQVCRGLQAAHERSLIHRDIKPSNVWVMDDDSVKIIDFGVAQMVQMDQSVGIKGTLVYMAPEQLQMKPATPASDIYSLAVVCYETLTRRRPFDGGKESEVAETILTQIPPPAADLNPAVNVTLSRVIHKALAKQPWNRYSSAREFAETLQKGLRNEPIEFFNPARIQPRIERAAKAFEQGDAQFALEILAELEAEGHIDPAIAPLRRQIEHAQRQKTVGHLLDSARTRFEHEEFPLALQKIEEVLQLDPGNAQALGLRTSIGNRTATEKIDEWLRLARQHLDNQAFGHAREAVANVLQLRPNDTRGTQFMSEIDHLEQEFLSVRKEKEQLYEAALEAYNAGEVTTALSKIERVVELDKKAPETAAPERAASYQNFYNKVRTEHDGLKNSYAEAKKHLADRNFSQALSITNEWLGRYPGHALFQALKFDIEEQQRQELSARIAEIDRQVDAEPDLDRRVHILEQAVAEFAGEPHFERQLRPVREKRDLVNAIAAKARYHEERGQFAEAAAQWEILGTIYGQYPGLRFEVERVAKKKEQQALAEAKSRWIEQVDRAIGAADYSRALALLTTAEAEFPSDAELLQLRQLANESLARAEEAKAALAQGQALWQQQWFDDALAAFRRAIDLDPKSLGIRGAVTDLLVERARSLVDADWRAAEPLIDRALEIDPGNVLAKSLRITARDHKRDEAVIACFTQARQFRASGDLDNAVAEAEKCLAAYPLDPRLAQLRDILVRERSELAGAKAPAAEPEALRAESAAATAGAGTTAPPLPPVHDTPEIAALLPDTVQVPAAPSVEQAPQLPTERGQLPDLPHCPKCGSALDANARFCAGCGTPIAAPPKPQPPAPVRKQPGGKPMVLWVGAGAAGVALLLAAVMFLPKLRKPAPSATGVRIEVRTSPPGAVIRVNGKIRGTSNFPLEEQPGMYVIDAALEGYQPASTTIELKRGATAPVELNLQPLPQTLRLITDLTDGKLTLDDQPARDLQDGQVAIDGVAAGRHTLKVGGRQGQAEISFDLIPGGVPQLGTPPVVKGISGLIVSSFANRARVYTTFSPAQVQVDGAPAGEAGPDGLQVSNLAAGTHELVVSDGKTQLKKVIEISNAPALTAFFQSDQNIGTMVVLTGGEDGVDIFIDGQKYRRQTSRGGQVRVQREPKQYRIRVAKQGFAEVAEQTIEVKRGEEIRVAFKMTPLPNSAHLLLHGAPGAQVFVDESAVGTVLPDGSFQVSSISPGEHSIELRKDKQRSHPVRKSFTAGQTVTVSDSDVTLHGGPGTLRLNVTPANAQVTIVRSGRPPQSASGNSVELDEGAYTVTARATGYGDRSEHVQVTGGQTTTVTLALVREAKRGPVAMGMEGWEDAAGWKQEAGWFVRRGGGFVLYRPVGNAGAYDLTLMAASGGVLRGRNLEWIAAYTDPKNYVLFRLEKDNFRRIACVNGKRTELVKKPHGLKLKDMVASLHVEVTPVAIITQANEAGRWIALDSWSAPDRNFADGRFGVMIEGRDEVRISAFKFTPKE